MKKFISITFILAATLLTACNKPLAAPDQHSTDTPSIIEPKTMNFTSETGSFSVEMPDFFLKDWKSQNYLLTGGSKDRLYLEAGYQQYYLKLNRFYKADIALPLDQFVTYNISKFKNENLKNTSVVTMSLAGKKGLGISKELTINDQKQLYTLFAYEDGEFFKFIRMDTLLKNKKSAYRYLETAINSWTDIAVEQKFELKQAISIPNVDMTITIPSDWIDKTRTENKPNMLEFLSPDQAFYMTVFGQKAAEGYTYDLPTLVTTEAAKLPSATVTPVEVGPYNGYRLEHIDIVEEAWQNTIITYLFQIDNRLISIHFDVPISRKDSFQPTLEAILASLK